MLLEGGAGRFMISELALRANHNHSGWTLGVIPLVRLSGDLGQTIDPFRLRETLTWTSPRADRWQQAPPSPTADPDIAPSTYPQAGLASDPGPAPPSTPAPSPPRHRNAPAKPSLCYSCAPQGQESSAHNLGSRPVGASLLG